MNYNNVSLRKKLLLLAIPMAMEGLLSAGADLADTVMISSLGEASVSAVGLGTQIFFIHNMMIYGLCGGASTFMTQFYGKGDYKGIRKTLGFSIAGILCISMILFAVVLIFPGFFMNLFTNIEEVAYNGIPYIRTRSFTLIIYSFTLPIVMGLKSMQSVKLPVAAGCLSIAVNVSLNYVFIYGKFGFSPMGSRGAALATVIAMSVQLTVIIIGMLIQKHVLLQNIREFFSFDRRLAKELISNSIPTTLNETLWSAGMSAYNGIYGRISVMASAAAQAADIVTHVFTKAIFCVGDAALILVGEQIGKDEAEEAYKAAKQILVINVVLGALAGATIIAISRPVATLFNFQPECESFLLKILSIYACFMPLKVFNVTLITGVLRAGGDVKFAMKSELSVIWFITLPVIYILALVLHLPVYIVVLGAQIEDVMKAVILFRRFISRKWINNKVKNL